MLTFELDPIDELDPRSNDGEELVSVQSAPPERGHIEQLEGHHEAAFARARPFGHALPEPDGRERGLDGVGGPEMPPVLGRVVVEGQQRVLVAA